MIDHVALAARRRALHELAVEAEKHGVDGPLTFRRGPVKPAIGGHTAREIEHCPAAIARHYCQQRHVFGIAHLLERQGLEIGIGFDRLDEVGDLDRPRART